MANEVGRNFMQCVYDQNGNHVVQKCLQCVPPKYIKLIHASFYWKAMVLSTQPYGCRVIQVDRYICSSFFNYFSYMVCIDVYICMLLINELIIALIN